MLRSDSKQHGGQNLNSEIKKKFSQNIVQFFNDLIK